MKIFIGLAVVVLVGVGGYLFLFSKSEILENEVPLEKQEESNLISEQEVIPKNLPQNDTVSEATPEPVIPAKSPISDSKPAPSPVVAPIPSSVSVQISGFNFSPNSITVKKGATVVWTNNDGAPHTVTGDNGGPSSGTLKTGDVYSFTFNNPGTFTYRCSFHPSMKATIIVN